jgi:predicted DNA-binding protein with PD1-like motif
VGQLSQGEDLIHALQTICHERRIRCGTIQANGVLDELTICHYDRPGRTMGPARQFRSPMQILSATGTISEEGGKVHLNVNLVASRQRDNGIELLGGLCMAAKVLTCEVIIDTMDDLLLRRAVDKGTNLRPWTEWFVARPEVKPTEGKPAAPEEKMPPPPVLEPSSPAVVEEKPSWADAVMASVRAEAEPATEEAEEHATEENYRPVRQGDILEHQQFGRCVVQRVDSDQETVTVRLRNNRLVRLNLEVLHLRYQGDEEGHQVFATGTEG